MSLDKAIKYGKEHREEYRGGKAVSEHCRNHGGRRKQWECEYCKNNRTYKAKKNKIKEKEQYKEYKNYK